MATKSDRFPKKYFNAEGLKASGPLVLEIKEERLEDVIDPKTGHAVEKSVVTFADTEQKLVPNSTNWDSIVKITGCSDTKDWPGHKIELYADQTRMTGKLVDCVRVRKPSAPLSPREAQRELNRAFADASDKLFGEVESDKKADFALQLDDEIPI
jgi:hypothetical protein